MFLGKIECLAALVAWSSIVVVVVVVVGLGLFVYVFLWAEECISVLCLLLYHAPISFNDLFLCCNKRSGMVYRNLEGNLDRKFARLVYIMIIGTQHICTIHITHQYYNTSENCMGNKGHKIRLKSTKFTVPYTFLLFFDIRLAVIKEAIQTITRIV